MNQKSNKPNTMLFRPAWKIERELRLSTIPLDRRTHESNWYTSDTVFPTGDDLVALFWHSSVPGSGAPEIPYLEMVQAMGNKGYNVSKAEILLHEGLAMAESCRIAHGGKPSPDLRALTAELLHEIHYAPRDLSHPYWRYEHPQEWNEVREAMPAATVSETGRPPLPGDLEARIHAGWLGQLAGGAFGTAIEGYHSEQLHKVYGRIDEYITEPETTNDDVVYELAFLDALEKHGRNLTSCDIALEWIRQIPFGWSAEWIALHNLADGIFPPESGSWHNPYSNWIGAQMRGMVCGLVSPAWPMEAARLAYLDGVVSHAENGVYGEIYAAVLTSLAFNLSNPRTLIINAAEFIPAKSEYAAVLTKCFETVRSCAEPEAAWQELDIYFERYNWIHAYPNIAAVITALWFGNCDMTESFRILAHAGLDVDCNAGLVGTVIGIINGISDKWGKPLNDTLETYLAGKEHLSIQALANTTARLATL